MSYKQQKFSLHSLRGWEFPVKETLEWIPSEGPLGEIPTSECSWWTRARKESTRLIIFLVPILSVFVSLFVFDGG